MAQMTADGRYSVMSAGFVATGDSDQSEGRGGQVEIGRFTTVEEAIAAARGRGVQGDPGEVAAFEFRLYDGGLVREHRERLIARRQTPDNSWLVGWLDLREYADRRLPPEEHGPCTCDALTPFFTTAENAARRPWIKSRTCPVHGREGAPQR